MKKKELVVTLLLLYMGYMHESGLGSSVCPLEKWSKERIINPLLYRKTLVQLCCTGLSRCTGTQLRVNDTGTRVTFLLWVTDSCSPFLDEYLEKGVLDTWWGLRHDTCFWSVSRKRETRTNTHIGGTKQQKLWSETSWRFAP